MPQEEVAEPNKTLHRTAARIAVLRVSIALQRAAAGELGRSAHKNNES